MKERQLLFATYHDENMEEGLSYAIELAKTMNDGLEILLVYKRKLMEKLDDMMTAITFAEEDVTKTAREMISDDYRKSNEDYEKKIALLKETCSKAGIAANVSTAATDAVSAVKNILRQNSRIDMVILSPSITNDNNITSRTLNKLVKTASRPVVTMAKNAQVA